MLVVFFYIRSNFDRLRFYIFLHFSSHQTANNKPRTENGESQTTNYERRVPTLIGFDFGSVFFLHCFSHTKRRTTNQEQQTVKVKLQMMKDEFQL